MPSEKFPTIPHGHRIRYNYNKHGRKDVLYTIKDSSVIHFGIARANTRCGDIFNRVIGVRLAQSRAIKAQNQNRWSYEDTPYSLYGSIMARDIVWFLREFDEMGTK